MKKIIFVISLLLLILVLIFISLNPPVLDASDTGAREGDTVIYDIIGDDYKKIKIHDPKKIPLPWNILFSSGTKGVVVSSTEGAILWEGVVEAKKYKTKIK